MAAKKKQVKAKGHNVTVNRIARDGKWLIGWNEKAAAELNKAAKQKF